MKQPADLLAQTRPGEGAVQHMVRTPDLRGQWHLAADAPDRFCAGEPIPFFEARDLGIAVCPDDDGLIDAFVDAGFEEERHVVDDYGVRILSCGLSRESDLLARDTGVNDGFERTAFGWLAKDDGCERLAIETAVRIEDGIPERFDDLAPGRLVGLYDIAGQPVGIDHNRATLLEHLGDGALAGGDAACEADQNHGGGA